MHFFTTACDQLLKDIDSLLANGKVLYLRKRKADNGVYIADVLQKLKFSEQFCSALHWITFGKERNTKNLGDFVRCFSSFNKAQAIFKTENIRRGPFGSDSDFARDIYVLMEFCKGKARRSYQRVPKDKCSFCCLCWREVDEKSHYYCKYHLPTNKQISQSKANYYRDTRMIKNELDSGHHLWANGLKLNPFVYESVLDKTIEFRWPEKLKRPTDYDWMDIATEMITQANIYLPYTYKKINSLASQLPAMPLDFVKLVLKKLEPTTSQNELENLGWKRGVHKNDVSHVFRQLQAVLIRHEAYEILRHKSKPRGPKKGIDKQKDLSLRVEIKKLKKEGLNNSNIGKKLGKSRQRISVLAKELEL